MSTVGSKGTRPCPPRSEPSSVPFQPVHPVQNKGQSSHRHSPADPWSLTDGVMAMAIKLANDGATKSSGEFDAARRYYCGSNIGRSVCIDYANKVLYWAENYKDRL